MKKNTTNANYFPYEIQISGEIWERLDLATVAAGIAGYAGPSKIRFFRHVADRLNRHPATGRRRTGAAGLAMFAMVNRIFRYLLDQYLDRQCPDLEDTILAAGKLALTSGPLSAVVRRFAELYPGVDLLEKRAASAEDYLALDDSRHRKKRRITRELLLLLLAMENPALEQFRTLFDDRKLATSSPLVKVTETLDKNLKHAPPCDPFNLPILELLRVPIRRCPGSLSDQLEFIRRHWAAILPPDILDELLAVFDIVKEEERQRGGEPGPPPVLVFGRTVVEALAAGDYPEPERFSLDRDWMPNVVLIAKMVYVWLDQLSKKYGRSINRLDEIPDEELDILAAWGFTGLWLIGIWERSPASRKIKQLRGNPDAISSAYSLYDYIIAGDLGGEPALENLRHRTSIRGIRLASDMVPNHTGIDSRWTREHPDWFVQLDYPPYPAYRFDGPDLSSSPDISLRIEDGYWSGTDAAVVFQHIDNHTGRVRYLYHGNDGTSTPWNDTAQLNYLIPEVREAVIRTIIHVARRFPIIRFDAAMTLAKKHYQRLWFPQPGLGGGIPSRAEHGMHRMRFDELFPLEFWREVVDRIAAEAPDTLLLAEAFWLMEGYFVRTLGMHRVYNSAFMNMLKMEENAKYRQTIKNVLEFNPEILQRFVNFMNNPDERTAVEQFGKEGKYLGAAVLLVTMPGLPMFGHGQIEGFTEKYGMEYRRAYWSEEPDLHLVDMHVRKIFPLMKKRRLFSGAENFVLYDFFSGDHVNEDVFAYSNSDGYERALVVYHNRFASTSGWIRTSSARTVKSGTGETRQVRTTLGEALNVKCEGRYYYRFRDYCSGLEYLRHAPELAEKGLFVELEGYEYHAFLDFQEIRDDDYGTWGKLCHDLQGRPVGSLDEDIKQIRYAGVIKCFETLTAGLADHLAILLNATSARKDAERTEKLIRERLLALLSVLHETVDLHIDKYLTIEQVLREIHFAAGLSALKSRRKGAKAALDLLKSMTAPDRGFNRLFLAMYLLLHRTGNGPDGEDTGRDPARMLTDLGLDRTVAVVFGSAADDSAGGKSPWGSDAGILLLKVLLAHQSVLSVSSETKWTDRMERLFADVAASRFLLVHWSGNVEWFNRERFEDLLHWLFLTSVVAFGSDTVDTAKVIDQILRMHGVMCRIRDAAENAGWRLDTFLRAPMQK